MTDNERRLLIERSRETIRLSLSLVPATRAVHARAAALRHETALYRRRQFSIVIRGVDGIDGEALRAKVAAGVLPRIAAAKTFYGHGDGKVCCVCDLAISPYQIEVEADFGGALTLRFHSFCFRDWAKAREAA